MDASRVPSAEVAQDVPVIDLASAPGERMAWSRPKSHIYLWAIAERLFVTNSWQISSRLRVAVLRKFGAKIGSNVTFRPRTRVSFPWNLDIGDNCWIGEGVWFHNQTQVSVGDNCVISQEAFITTGSHAVRTDMALMTSPVTIDSGAWVTSRCMVLGGTTLGASCVITPNTVVPAKTVVPPNAIFGNPNPAQVLDHRFPTKSD